MRTAAEKYKRLEQMLDARLASIEAQGFNTGLIEWRKLRVSERRWRDKRREWHKAIIDEMLAPAMAEANIALRAVDDLLNGRS